MHKILERIQNKPLKYSILISILISIITPHILIACWESCTISYESIIGILGFGMAIFQGILFGFISLIIKVLVLIFPIYFILKNKKLSVFLKLVLLFLCTIALLFIQSTIFYNFTNDGIKIKEFENYIDSSLKDFKNLKTKNEVINYIKSRENYIDVNCRNPEASESEFLEDRSSYYDKVIIFNKITGKNIKDTSSSRVLDNSYFCDIEVKIEPNVYYDCIIYTEDSTKDLNRSRSEICFIDNKTRYININTHFSSADQRKFYKSYFDNKLIIDKSYRR